MSINQKIKEIRIQKGLTLEELAKLSNLTKGHLSKIERASRNPTISTLQTIAKALGTDISEFFEKNVANNDASQGLEIIRKTSFEDTAKEQFTTQAGYSYKPLLREFKNKYMSPFLMIIKKGRTDPFSHDSEEFNFVLEGAFELEFEGKTYFFEAGDSFYLDSRIPHRFVNKQENPTVLLAVDFNYRRF